jgi:3-hydroxyacyl-CoA dehydrogenase
MNTIGPSVIDGLTQAIELAEGIQGPGDLANVALKLGTPGGRVLGRREP